MHRVSPRKSKEYGQCHKPGCGKPTSNQKKYCSRACSPLGGMKDDKKDLDKYGFCYKGDLPKR